MFAEAGPWEWKVARPQPSSPPPLKPLAETDASATAVFIDEFDARDFKCVANRSLVCGR